MRPPLDVDPHFAACVRQILREDAEQHAEQAAWEAKIDRRRQMESRGVLFGAWLVGAVLFGGLAWGVRALRRSRWSGDCSCVGRRRCSASGDQALGKPR